MEGVINLLDVAYLWVIPIHLDESHKVAGEDAGATGKYDNRTNSSG